ncbi:hypothetical protein GF361_04115 [Candidatus Woesearchaeota archaeon]|nr:hypothetical protein [Candidatus Woesearchaeota archaeon]
MRNKKLTSMVLTVTVIAILLLSAPVSAITISVDTNKDTYYKADDSTITITGTIDIENTENLNITGYVVKIKNSTNNLVKNCSISTSGAVTGCGNITASITSNAAYTNDTRYGYGYGSSTLNGAYTDANQSFGYGYGYGYSAGVSNEIVVTITWNITADTSAALADDYTVNIFTKAEGNGNTRYYADSTEASFTINSGSAPSSSTSTGPSSNGLCSPTWKCSEWSECINGKQTRTCEDKWSCGTDEDKPKETRSCKMPAPVEKPKPSVGKATSVLQEPKEPEEPEPTIPLGTGIVVLISLIAIASFFGIKIYMNKK